MKVKILYAFFILGLSLGSSVSSAARREANIACHGYLLPDLEALIRSRPREAIGVIFVVSTAQRSISRIKHSMARQGLDVFLTEVINEDFAILDVDGPADALREYLTREEIVWAGFDPNDAYIFPQPEQVRSE